MENTRSIVAYHIGCMTSLTLWCQGRFFEAAEFASIAITQAENNGYSGIAGPFDAMLVLSRCELELSQLNQSIETSNQIERKAESARHVALVFHVSTGTRSRIQITQGLITHVVDVISRTTGKTQTSANTQSTRLDHRYDRCFLALRFKRLETR